MCIGTILAKMALLLLLEVLAHLCFVVVVRDVQHLILDFNRKLLQEEGNKRTKVNKSDRHLGRIILRKNLQLSHYLRVPTFLIKYKLLDDKPHIRQLHAALH